MLWVTLQIGNSRGVSSSPILPEGNPDGPSQSPGWEIKSTQNQKVADIWFIFWGLFLCFVLFVSIFFLRVYVILILHLPHPGLASSGMVLPSTAQWRCLSPARCPMIWRSSYTPGPGSSRAPCCPRRWACVYPESMHHEFTSKFLTKFAQHFCICICIYIWYGKRVYNYPMDSVWQPRPTN